MLMTGQQINWRIDGYDIIRSLYATEDWIKDPNPAHKNALPQQLSQPIPNDLHTWLQANSRRVPKRTA